VVVVMRVLRARKQAVKPARGAAVMSVMSFSVAVAVA
jgi:hypothetical protein